MDEPAPARAAGVRAKYAESRAASRKDPTDVGRKAMILKEPRHFPASSTRRESPPRLSTGSPARIVTLLPFRVGRRAPAPREVDGRRRATYARRSCARRRGSSFSASPSRSVEAPSRRATAARHPLPRRQRSPPRRHHHPRETRAPTPKPPTPKPPTPKPPTPKPPTPSPPKTSTALRRTGRPSPRSGSSEHNDSQPRGF